MIAAKLAFVLGCWSLLAVCAWWLAVWLRGDVHLGDAGETREAARRALRDAEG